MSNTAVEQKFIGLAWDVVQHSNCRRRKVGVVIVLEGSVIITAANGTPAGMTSCNDGGCPRCLSDVPSGELYDSCLCTHAEQLAVAKAAREGLRTEGAALYCTLRPCLTCTKICLGAGIKEIVYDESIQFSSDVEQAYEKLIQETGLHFTQYTNSIDKPNEY